AIVAYRQPVTAPEIQELRGVSVSGVLKTLLERRLVRIAGRKEVVGKPFLYATTREFLVHFGLRSVQELPPLEQFEDMISAMEGDLPFDGDAEGDRDHEEAVEQEIAALQEAEDETEDDEDDSAADVRSPAADDPMTDTAAAPTPPHDDARDPDDRASTAAARETRPSEVSHSSADGSETDGEGPTRDAVP
ncbi:MAG: SMC-Scp complex subunit ScpB, partial [Acidobacteriota bacterium]